MYDIRQVLEEVNIGKREEHNMCDLIYPEDVKSFQIDKIIGKFGNGFRLLNKFRSMVLKFSLWC